VRLEGLGQLKNLLQKKFLKIVFGIFFNLGIIFVLRVRGAEPLV
jgi:hypothetical protein